MNTHLTRVRDGGWPIEVASFGSAFNMCALGLLRACSSDALDNASAIHPREAGAVHWLRGRNSQKRLGHHRAMLTL